MWIEPLPLVCRPIVASIAHVLLESAWINSADAAPRRTEGCESEAD
jgi:hypothetical protein